MHTHATLFKLSVELPFPAMVVSKADDRRVDRRIAV
jgi:hypothetical protein